jgi:hypothetical protein
VKVIKDTISDKSFIHRLIVTDVDEDVVEDACLDILVELYPNSTITCLDIDSDECNMYYLTFLVEER